MIRLPLHTSPWRAVAVILTVVAVVGIACQASLTFDPDPRTTAFLRGMGIEVTTPSSVPTEVVDGDRIDAIANSIEERENLRHNLEMFSMWQEAISGPGSAQLDFRPVDHPIIYLAQWRTRNGDLTVAIIDARDASILGFWRVPRN